MPPAETLYAENLALKSERDALRASLDEREGTILDLKRQLEWLRRQVFGPGKGDGARSAEMA